MYLFLLPLLLGFVLAGASAFTGLYSRRWGSIVGRRLTSFLRNFTGIPLYMIGLVMAWRIDPTMSWAPSEIVRGLGWVLIVSGSLPILVGHWQLGWQTHLPSAEASLMDQGWYAYVRHPIYVGAFVVFIGLAAIHPTHAWLIACFLSIIFFLTQARLEEIDLTSRMPAYRSYMERVPAFLPLALQRWGWLYPIPGFLLAVGVFYLWGLSLWTALLATVMVICPILFLSGLSSIKRYGDKQCNRAVDDVCCHQDSNSKEGQNNERPS